MPRGKKKVADTQEKGKRGRKPKEETPKAERRVAAKGEKPTPAKLEREITDTVGITYRLRESDKPPKVGGLIRIEVPSKKEEFELPVKHVHPRKHGGWTIWLFLPKGGGLGPRWRECRLSKCVIHTGQ